MQGFLALSDNKMRKDGGGILHRWAGGRRLIILTVSVP